MGLKNEVNRSLTKNQRRRLKKKLEKKNNSIFQGTTTIKSNENNESPTSNDTNLTNTTKTKNELNVKVEYISRDIKKDLEIDENDPAFPEFQRILGKFSTAEELCGTTSHNKTISETQDTQEQNYSNINQENEYYEENEYVQDKTLSRKQKKKMKQLSVAELKQLVSHPDVVEAHDVTAADPRLLVYLKSYRNTVPVPHHWCHKRKYLQGKRGIEKIPFVLPEYIAQTGITEVRGLATEEDEKKKSKQKARERVQPKMGRADIDYQVLHDAFFRYQTKPPLTILGDLYYEGKEFEVKVKKKAPGHLSDELKTALGMVEGMPPPWLLNVQRYGPPPAYPNLKIPGLNAPIPEGASFGYHPGGWGKPPVDEMGVPLYGDVFAQKNDKSNGISEPINKERWGELEEVKEETDEEDEDEEEPSDAMEPEVHALDASGMETPLLDGITSVASTISTSHPIDLRKNLRGTETPDVPHQLYSVLEQKQTAVGSSLYGSGHMYVVPNSTEEKSTQEQPEKEMKRTRVRRRFEDAPPMDTTDGMQTTESTVTSMADNDELDEEKRRKKKLKTEKNKKLKDFKF